MLVHPLCWRCPVPNPAPAVSHVRALTETYLPHLRPAQQRGLAEWVTCVLDAESGCEAAILAAVAPLGRERHALRARLREFLADGAERAAPCATSLEVEGCFAPLLGWVLAWWTGATLPLAIDATALRDRQVVLSLSVLYRGSAIPVAWVVLPHRGKGAWLPHLARLLQLLAPAIPAGMRVLVMTDRGLWSPRLWRQIKENGWHPLMRIRPDATFAPAGQRRQRATELVPGAGWYWVGEGIAYKHKAKQIAGTLLVVWGAGQQEPWLLLSDLPPDAVDGTWYGLRVWIELGFRALKSFGWQVERTRRTDPARIARHWLGLAIATLLALAVGTRLEEADVQGLPPGRVRRPRTTAPVPARPRQHSLFALGRGRLHRLVVQCKRCWQALWLWPEALPPLPDDLHVIRHGVTSGGLHL
jgi:Transposase DDE domain